MTTIYQRMDLTFTQDGKYQGKLTGGLGSLDRVFNSGGGPFFPDLGPPHHKILRYPPKNILVKGNLYLILK